MFMLRRPIIVILLAMAVSFLLCLLLPEWKPILTEIWMLLLIWFAVLFIHELGHVLFGILVNLRFQFLAVGPIFIQRVDGKLKVFENKEWMFFGGIVLFLPSSFDMQNLARKWVIMTAGGPLMSLGNFLFFIFCIRQRASPVF